VLLFSQLSIPFMQGALPIMPAFAIIYYWALFRPSGLPLWVIGLVSIVHDVLYGLPMGSSLFVFLLLFVVCAWMRRRLMFHHFSLAWVVFAPMLIGISLTLSYWQYFTGGIAMDRWMAAYDLPFFLSWLCYPLFHLALNWCYHRLPAD